jgi:hypothetical protein
LRGVNTLPVSSAVSRRQPVSSDRALALGVQKINEPLIRHVIVQTRYVQLEFPLLKSARSVQKIKCKTFILNDSSPGCMKFPEIWGPPIWQTGKVGLSLLRIVTT